MLHYMPYAQAEVRIGIQFFLLFFLLSDTTIFRVISADDDRPHVHIEFKESSFELLCACYNDTF